jgi:hypothetical protein
VANARLLSVWHHLALTLRFGRVGSQVVLSSTAYCSPHNNRSSYDTISLSASLSSTNNTIVGSVII